jgi:transcriptional regulator with XRE-family HTH domain
MTDRENLNETKRQTTQKLINDAILGKGWSTTDIALMLDISRSTVMSWSNGRTMATNAFRTALSELPEIVSNDALTLVSVKLRVVNAEKNSLMEKLKILQKAGQKPREEHRISLKISKAIQRGNTLSRLKKNLEHRIHLKENPKYR